MICHLAMYPLNYFEVHRFVRIASNSAFAAWKEKQTASSEGEKSETEESQLANQASLDKLAELLQGTMAAPSQIYFSSLG